MDYFGINSSEELPKIKEVLADQIIEPTAIKDITQPDEENNEEIDETEALAVSDGGELIINNEQGEGEEN